jgi:hypothetical protein
MASYSYDYQFDSVIRVLLDIDEKLGQILEIEMDKKIAKIQKDTKKVLKEEGELKVADKKRDKFVDAGKKALKNK